MAAFGIREIQVQYFEPRELHGEAWFGSSLAVSDGSGGFGSVGEFAGGSSAGVQCRATSEGDQTASYPGQRPTLGRQRRIASSDPCIRSGGQNSVGTAPATML